MSQPDDIQYPALEEGAPAWVVTFGDLMSLLLCFFVLLLSFSEMDKAKYKEVSGSLAKAFGVQRKIKAFEAPKGIKMISRDFDQELIPARPREEFIAMQQREQIGLALKKEVATGFQEMQDLIRVDVGEKEVTIRLMGETAFDSGKAEIKAQMIPLLLKIGSVLAQGDGDVIIAGHTDDVPVSGGPYGSNLKLSIARSATVAEFLLSKSAIPASRVATMGFGKYRPIESNDTAEGRKHNRRVEIILKAPESAAAAETAGPEPVRKKSPILKKLFPQ
ncbi:MAG: flagellar motor protein MotB [Desulfobacterales bacterium]